MQSLFYNVPLPKGQNNWWKWEWRTSENWWFNFWTYPWIKYKNYDESKNSNSFLLSINDNNQCLSMWLYCTCKASLVTMSSYNWLKRVFRLFYLSLEGGPFFPRVHLLVTQTLSKIWVKVHKSLGAHELRHTWIMKHMNYKVHNTCHP